MAYGSRTHWGPSRGATVDDASAMPSAPLRRASRSKARWGLRTRRVTGAGAPKERWSREGTSTGGEEGRGRKRVMRRGEHSKGTSVESRDGAGEQQTWGTGGAGVTREPFGFTGFLPNFPFTVSNGDALSHTTLCRLILESTLLCLRGPVYEWQLLHEHLLITLENVSCLDPEALKSKDQ